MNKGIYFGIHICKAGCMSLFIKVFPTNLPQNHVDSLIRIQSQGSTADLLSQPPPGQSLGICVQPTFQKVLLQTVI